MGFPERDVTAKFFKSLSNSTTGFVAIDLGDKHYQLCVDEGERGSAQYRFEVNVFWDIATRLPKSTKVYVEACSGSSWVADQFAELGISCTMIPPHVPARVRGANKSDAIDAEAILLIAKLGNYQPVNHRGKLKRHILQIHKTRSLLVKQKYQLALQMRGFLRESGYTGKHGKRTFTKEVDAAMPFFAPEQQCLLQKHLELIDTLEDQIKSLETDLSAALKKDEVAFSLLGISGVGLLSATAFYAYIDKPHDFSSGKKVVSFLGLAPRLTASGQSARLGAITKAGNRYLRSLLYMGAAAAMPSLAKRETKDGKWIASLRERAGYKKTAVALAAKNARIMLSVLKSGEPYKPAIE